MTHKNDEMPEEVWISNIQFKTHGVLSGWSTDYWNSEDTPYSKYIRADLAPKPVVSEYKHGSAMTICSELSPWDAAAKENIPLVLGELKKELKLKATSNPPVSQRDIDTAYNNAVSISKKTNSSVSFDHDGITYTVKPHRLARKIYEMEQELAQYKQGDV